MNKERFLNDSVIEEFHDILEKPNKVTGLYSFRLVGGAVVDILEGRKPKDYDFVEYNNQIIERFIENGYKFSHATKTAKTYQKGDKVIQFIKFIPSQFGFTIAQSSYNFKNKELIVDRDSFDTKTLVPVNFEIRQNVASALRRVYHWRKKGYEINEYTYISLVNQVLRDGKESKVGS